MNITLEIDPKLLLDAIQILRDAQDRYEADACALCRLATPDARELAQERLEAARTAGDLIGFFAEQ